MGDLYNVIGGGNPMNWAQQRPLPTQDETMGTLLEALRAQSQTQFAHSPFGGSFNRRFGGNSFSPIQNELDAPSAKTGQELGPAEQARMITALQSAAEQGGQFIPQMTTRRTGSGTYSGPAIESSEAPMQSQPWYGAYLAAAEGGADLPMVRGSGGTPIDGQKQAAYKANRAQDMQGRKRLVQNKAQAKSDQRGVRMGNLAPDEAALNGLQRVSQQGGLGGMDPTQLAMLGPDAYVRLQAVMQQAGADQWKQAAVDDPRLVWANAGAQEGTGMDLPSFIRQWGGQSAQATPESLYERSGGDWEKYKIMANAAGMDGQATLNSWEMLTGEKMGGPQQPSIMDALMGMMGGQPSYQHDRGQPYPIPYG